MPRAGFKPAIPATKRPQTYALDYITLAATTECDYNNSILPLLSSFYVLRDLCVLVTGAFEIEHPVYDEL
jgi:hypothetical protein